MSSGDGVLGAEECADLLATPQPVCQLPRQVPPRQGFSV